MPARLYLVRHGEVAEAWRNRIYGRLDVPLSPDGRAEAERVARWIPSAPEPPALVLSSGLERTDFGAQAIAAALGLPVERDADLSEIDRGTWAGRSPDEIEAEEPGALGAWFATPSTVRPPGGESLADLSARVLPRLDHWSARHAGKSLAIVAHLWVIRVAVCAALRLGLDRATALDVRTGGLVVLDWPAGETERAHVRPTLAGFGTDAVPHGQGWFRGPHRAR